MRVASGAQRILLDGPPAQLDRFLQPAEVARQAAGRTQRLGAARGELERSTEGRVGALPVPVVGHMDHPERQVSLGQIGLQRPGLARAASRARAYPSATGAQP